MGDVLPSRHLGRSLPVRLQPQRVHRSRSACEGEVSVIGCI